MFKKYFTGGLVYAFDLLVLLCLTGIYVTQSKTLLLLIWLHAADQM